MHNDLVSNGYVAQPDDTERIIKEFWDVFKTKRFFVVKKSPLLTHYVESISKEKYPVDRNRTFCRARILDEGIKKYEDKDLHAPEEKLVGVGRLNPKRIRYLYVSEDDRTAAAELRPWKTAITTIAKVIPKQDLNVVNFVPTDEEKQRLNSFKRQISEKFSAPVRPNTSDLEYLPTQAIAEYIKLKGFDGIRYQSSIYQNGVNYCFFNPDCFDITISHNLDLKSIQYNFQ